MINNDTLNALYKKDAVKKDIKLNIYDGSTLIGTLTNANLHQDTFELYESICSQDNFRFGGCEAGYIKFKMENKYSKLRGKTIKAIQVVDNNELNLGTFKVEDDTASSDKQYREIVAYDELYSIRNRDITKWYNQQVFPMQIKKFRNMFFELFGITQVDITLPNDEIYLYKNTYEQNVNAGDVITDICEINGCFGKMNRDGKFEYLYLSHDNDTAIELPKNIRKDMTYEDYLTHKINKIKLVQQDVDFDFYYGDGDNQYPISMRILSLGTNKETLKTILSNIYDKIAGTVFTPVDLQFRGNPCIETGDYAYTYNYDNEKIYTYILQRTLSINSFEGMTDEYISKGTETYTREKSTQDEQIYSNSKDINDLYKNNFYAYTFTNNEALSINNTDKFIIKFNLSAVADADVIFIAGIPIIADCDGYAVIKYYKDDNIVENDTVRTYFHKGYNILTLTNFMFMDENGRLTLTVSLATEYVESTERKQSAKIISIENYIKNTDTDKEYTEVDVDTTIPKLSIAKETIKAVCFARGLAGNGKWDGTINIQETVNNINIPNKNITVQNIIDVMTANTQIPLFNDSGFVNIFGKTELNVINIDILDITDSIEFNEAIKYFIIDTSKSSQYTFDSKYVTISDDSFKLQTSYEFNSIAETIDTGKMQYIDIDLSQFSTVEGVTLTNE